MMNLNLQADMLQRQVLIGALVLRDPYVMFDSIPDRRAMTRLARADL